MNFKPENVVHLYAGAFVDELARAGIRDACVCPGSRSTPLAMRLADQPAIKLWMHLDERSAGFFALGLAKAQHQPVILLCTSGTAAANLMPSIVEAHYAHVPLVVLTADRPPELRDTGAAQTIDQLKLYGPYAKWFSEMALPEATADMLRYVRTVACRAVAQALEDPAGVVHLNFPFREPLVPLPADGPDHVDDVATVGRPDGQPFVRVTAGPRQAGSEMLAQLAAELCPIQRGLIVAGPQTDRSFPAAVTRLSAELGYPLLADPLSQVRCGPHDRQAVVDAYDAFLRGTNVVERLAPQVILRFGMMPTSKPALLYLQRYADVRQILVDGGGGWNDAARLASDVVHADAALFCAALADALQARDCSRATTPWLDLWLELNRRSRQAVTAQVESFDEPFEGRVFTELAECLPEGATCYVSNSMPVRDLDTFWPGHSRSIRFLANRGANGIDGIVSSALGASAAGEGPLILVIGDLALFHDLNGLLAAKRYHLRATIILTNNDGGGIFSFLPQAAYPPHFEQLFGTPHGLDFRPAVEMYGATFIRMTDWRSFRAAVNTGLEAAGVTIIEVPTHRERNVSMHRAVWQAVSAALADFAVARAAG